MGFKVALDGVAEFLSIAMGRGEPGDLLGIGCEFRFQELEKELVLAFEIRVDGAFRKPRGLGDRFHARAGEAVTEERFARRLKQAFARSRLTLRAGQSLQSSSSRGVRRNP